MNVIAHTSKPFCLGAASRFLEVYLKLLEFLLEGCLVVVDWSKVMALDLHNLWKGSVFHACSLFI